MTVHRFWAGLDKVPEPVSIDNPTGDKLTDTATVQTIKVRRAIMQKLAILAPH